jgi:ferredoxin, 2Fe-2S
MLSMRPDRQTNSRLSCQIQVTEELDGLVVNVPEYQM